MAKQILFYLLVFSISTLAQMSDLEINPHHINFTDKFEKISTVQISNHGGTEITIDSLNYDDAFVFIRNNNFTDFPVLLYPDSSISIDVILSNYFVLQGADTTSVITIFNNSSDPIKDVNVSVNYEMDHKMNGEIKGTVKDSLSYLADVKVLFFFDGIYLIDSTTTDANGNYEKELQSGNYFVAAVSDGYYMQFGNFKNSPLDADFIEVHKDSPQIVDFVLEAELQTNLSIEGVVYDIVTDGNVGEAIVVVRKGTHTPTKIQASTLADPFRSYSVLANSRGEFVIKNIQTSGDYYLEAFSQYYIPGYYNHMNEHEAFWENADSIDIVGAEMDRNIYLDRDSSYGGGVARGQVRGNNNSPDSANNSLVFAISTLNNKVYNYNFSKANGEFDLSALPSGSYKLVTDKIGYESSESSEFFVDATQDTALNIDILLIPTSVQKIFQIIKSFNLEQNYPNPFNPSTIIRYEIRDTRFVSLKIYSALGQEIATLVSETQNAGIYNVEFNSSNFGNNLASGLYFYSIKAGDFTAVKKMLLLK
jgi:hypothetical protein